MGTEIQNSYVTIYFTLISHHFLCVCLEAGRRFNLQPLPLPVYPNSALILNALAACAFVRYVHVKDTSVFKHVLLAVPFVNMYKKGIANSYCYPIDTF